jgi:hypothetical protein
MKIKLTSDILVRAVNDYRSEGVELMKRLGVKFGYDILIEDQYQELVWKGNPNVPKKGNLSENVQYRFHGGECFFHKKKTKQNIEVILSHPPKFGRIDCWFLKDFLDSTEEYKQLSKGVEWQSLKPMIDELYQSGRIEEIK